MSESSKSWGLYTIRKTVEYAGIALAVWQLGIPAAEKYIDSRVEQTVSKKVSFRKALSEELSIPEDRIHIEIAAWIHSINDLNEQVVGIIPHIEEEIMFVHPRLIVKPQGEFWINQKGEEHRVHRMPDGSGMYFDNNMWNYIYR